MKLSTTFVLMRPIVIGCAAILFLVSACTPPNFSESDWLEKVESARVEQLYEPHEIDGVFFNPWMKIRDRTIEVLKWKLTNAQSYTAEEEQYLPRVLPDTKSKIQMAGDRDFIAWLGHGSFLIRTGKAIWLLDPMFSKRALLPARFTKPALTAQDINELFPMVNVVISHNHYDHLDEDSISALSESYTFYIPKGLQKTVIQWQPRAHIVEMDWWQKKTLGDGYEIHCLPAQHWSRRAFDGFNTSLWASYMFITPEKQIYFGGDSGYFIGYREFGRKYPNIKYALMPVTAYHPRWFMHEAHMNAREAIQAFQDLGGRYFIPTQWGTFRLGDNPPGYTALDLKRNIKTLSLNPKHYLIPEIGQLIMLD